MVSTQELESLLELARNCSDEEPAFFRRLLEGPVYTHARPCGDNSQPRLAKVRHPNGFYAVPFFTSEAKAVAEAPPETCTVKYSGRQFLELTLGVAVMLNPSSGGCVLYPEEIEVLLSADSIARVETTEWAENPSLGVGSPERPPDWLVAQLIYAFAGIATIEAGYLIEARGPEQLTGGTLVVVIGVPPNEAERAARACLTSLQRWHTQPPPIGLDLLVYDPAFGVPDYVQSSGIQPFFVRPVRPTDSRISP